MTRMHHSIRLHVKQTLISGALLLSLLSTAQAIPVGMNSQSAEYSDLLNSKELSQYSRDLFGSVISAVRKGDYQKAKLLIRRVLSAYPEHPIAWEFDGTLKFLDGEYKDAEQSLIKSLKYMPERATPRAKLGLVRLAQDDFAGAKQLFSEALTQDPDNWIAHRYLARIADSEGNTLQAAEHYKHLLESGSGEITSIHAEYARNLAQLKRYDEIVSLLASYPKTSTNPELTLLLAEAYMNLGNLEAGRKQLAFAKKIAPKDPRTSLLSAIDLRLSGQAQQSAKTLQQLIANDSSNASFHYHYGLALLQLGKLIQAQQAFQNAANNSPATSALRIALANQFNALKQPEKVIQTLEPFIEKQLREDALYMLVQAYVDSGKWQQGLQHAERMIEKRPQFVPARLLRIELLRGLNRRKEAEQYARQTLNLFPASTDALKSYVRLLFRNHDKQSALAKLKQVVDKHPDNSAFNFMLANQYQAANDPAKAEAVYRKLLTTMPENPGLLNNLAIVLSQQTGKLQQALETANKAHKKAPNNAAIADSFGWILHLAKRHQQAEQTLQQALKLAPDLIDAQCHLGLVRQQRGKRESALLKSCLNPGFDSNIQALAKQALGK